MQTIFLAAASLWCVLAVIWLVALGDAKARWMHWTHALLPIAAVGLYPWLPAGSVPAQAVAQWLAAGAAVWVFLTLVWLLSIAIRNASIMDVVYTPSVSITLVVLLFSDGNYSARQLALAFIVIAWSARLVWHASDTNLTRGEQEPYARWRVRYAGRWWWRSYFQVFLLQGALIWIWMLSLALALAAGPGPLTPTDLAGVALWALGFVFQAGADWQLKRFKAIPENKGKVMRAGFWSLTRHPNYFGETAMWWGYFLFGLAHPYGWLGIASALYVTWFMSKGSAAPMLERHMLKTKPDYAQYVASVPAFFPRILRRKATVRNDEAGS